LPKERDITNEERERETSIAGITIALLLFFDAVSLTVSYVASREGLLFEGGGAVQPPSDFAMTK
jgi:hypothetical protein